MDHMEIYWALVSDAASLVTMGITGWIFYCLVKPFLQKRRYTGFIGITFFGIMAILKFCPYYMDSMLAYAIGVLSALVVMYLLDHRNLEQKIFLAVTFYLIEWISYGVALVPRNILSDVLMLVLKGESRIEVQFGIYVIVECLHIGLIFLFMAVAVRIIHRAYICKKENMSKKELLLMLAPSLSVLAGYWSFTFFSNAYLDDFNVYIWSIHAEYEWLKALYQMISFAAMFTVIVIYQGIKDSQRKEKENAVLSEQIENMENHISQIEVLYRDIQGLKHDMGNHVMTLEKLFMSKEQEEAAEYFAQLKGEWGRISPGIKSGNPVTDAILTEKHKEAAEKGIDFVCEFHYPEGTNINAFDVSVILNNSINNAIEGASGCESPYIHISSSRKKNAYMIVIKNNFTSEIVIDEENGLLETTKKDRQGHGFGLVNIKKVAGKYYGDIAIEQDGTEFILSIMLMVE